MYQLRQIQELEFELDAHSFARTRSPRLDDFFDISNLEVFTGLRRVHIRVHSYDEWKNDCFLADKMRFHSLYEPALRAAGYELVVEKVDLSIDEMKKA
jgi:hypothetical protein